MDCDQGNATFEENIVGEFLPRIRGLAIHLIRRLQLPSELEEEYISAGVTGLLEAARRYEPGGCAEFWTFAFPRVRGAMIDSLREFSDLPPRAYRLVRAYRLACDAEQESEATGRSIDPSHRESLHRVLEYLSTGAIAFRLSVDDAALCEDNDALQSLGPDDAFEQRERAAILRQAVSRLPEQERTLILEVYFHGKSIAEAGQELFGISRSWASRLHKRALMHLRELITEEPCSDSELRAELNSLEANTVGLNTGEGRK